MSSERLAILTGAAGHIGLAAARAFANDGWSLVLTDISDAVHEAAATISLETHQAIFPIQADISTENGAAEVADAAHRCDLPVKFLGMIAGVNQEAVPVEAMDMRLWDRIMTVNLRSNVLMIRECVKLLKASGGGAIATTSSWWGRSAHPYFSAYCASKAGVIALTQSAAAELAPDIRVNSVAPGNVGTPMHFDALEVEAEARGLSVAEMQEIEWSKIPLGRPADPDEIASAMLFLASPASSYLTGAVLDVNGGCGFY
jgi:NAD(P)-dependent dehydrogenase (short-subunit alcohol dehydrogenase family)